MLSDGHAVYTPGLSENRGGSVSYPAFDRIGNLWTQDASGSSQLYYEDLTGFGGPTYAGGSAASPFKYGGGNGCQTDVDTGFVLMGHRYMDPRTGRFISQDPAGDGDNWYAYADNDPVDEVDPSGLFMEMPPTGETMAHDAMMGFLGGLSFGESGMGGDGSFTKTDYTFTRTRLRKLDWGWGPPVLTDVQSTTFDMGGSGMFADPAVNERRPGESNAHYFFRGLWWAIQQALTSGADPGTLGAQGPPSGGGAKPASPDTANLWTEPFG